MNGTNVMDPCVHTRYQAVDGATILNGDVISLPSKANPPNRETDQRPKSQFSTDKAPGFNSRKQTCTLSWQQASRRRTAVIISFIIATRKSHERKGNITPAQKAYFNGILTALSLNFLVGGPPDNHQLRFTNPQLSKQAAFRNLAKILRWRFLAGSSHSVR
jgi:hypothetical protein